MKRLVIRADDAGSSHSANKAIFECASRGLARNVSLMAPGPVIEEAAQVLAGLENIDFGLHLTLNAEWDAPRWSSLQEPKDAFLLLDEDGAFTRTPMDLFRRGVSDEMLNQIEREAEAQLDRLRALGFEVSYLDEHMGVGWLPGVRERLQVLAEREGLRVALPVQGLPPSASSLAPIEAWLKRLDDAPDGDWLLVTHPGYDSPEMRRLSNAGFAPGQIAREREGDRQLLLDKRLKQELEQRQVLVARYSDVI